MSIDLRVIANKPSLDNPHIAANGQFTTDSPQRSAALVTLSQTSGQVTVPRDRLGITAREVKQHSVSWRRYSWHSSIALIHSDGGIKIRCRMGDKQLIKHLVCCRAAMLQCGSDGKGWHIRPMSHLQFYSAILSRNFIARQNPAVKLQVWHRSNGCSQMQPIESDRKTCSWNQQALSPWSYLGLPSRNAHVKCDIYLSFVHTCLNPNDARNTKWRRKQSVVWTHAASESK